MPSKSRKEQIEAMLADDPHDAFLRYGLAMEHVSAGDDEAAARCLRDLIAVDATYVPAYLQAGQALIRVGKAAEARELLARGVGIAQAQGNQHARDEMQGFLESII